MQRRVWVVGAALALSLAACKGREQQAAEPTQTGLPTSTAPQTGRDVTGGVTPGQMATVQGKVASLHGDELTIKGGQGDVTVQLTGLETTRNGEPVKRADLKEGTEVRASYTTKGRSKVVDRLEVLSPAGQNETGR